MDIIKNIKQEIENIKKLHTEKELALIDQGSLPCEYDKSDIESAKVIAISEVLEMIQKKFIENDNIFSSNDWIYITDNLQECLPKKDYMRFRAWLTIENAIGNRFTIKGFIENNQFYYVNGIEIKNQKVIAWKPYDNPKPYMEDKNN